MDEGLSFAWAPKALVFCLGQLAIGVFVARPLARGTSHQPAEFELWLSRLARGLGPLLLLALAARLWAQSAAAFGAGDALQIDNLRVIALDSRWGSGWRLQVLASVGLLASAWLLPGRRLGPMAFGACAVALGGVMPLLGHAAGSVPRHAIHVAHYLAAGAWIGTLGVMTLAAWHRRGDSGHALVVRGMVRRFSPVALAAAGTLAASGSVAAWLYVGSWAALWTTTYGLVLVMKLAAVVLVGACGRMNWRDARSGRPPRLAIMTFEWLAALLVVGLTGILTETEHP